jgi:LEA14-like dessication related protein
MQTLSRYFSILLIALVMSSCSSLSSLVQKPGLTVDDLKLKSFGLDSQTFAVRLKVDNPNSFSLPIIGLDYGLNVMGINVVDGTTSNGVRIPGNGSDFIEIDLNTNLMKSLPDLANAITSGNGNLDYAFNGAVKLDNALIGNVPFNKTGTFNLSLSDLLKAR